MKALFLLLPLAGCAALNGPNMSVDQLRAIASDKNAAVVCTQITGAGGQGTVITVTDDKGVIASGSITVEPNCKTTIVHTPPAKP